MSSFSTSAPRTNTTIAGTMAILVTLLLVAATIAGFALVPERVNAELPSEPVASTWVTNGTVRAIACDNGIVYIGGDFTKVGPVGGTMVTRNYIAAINEATGEATSWNPNANGLVRALDIYGSFITVGGNFTSIGGKARSFVAQLELATGKATAWNANANNVVLAVNDNWVGGLFTSIGGSACNYVAGLDAATGAATWTGGADDWVWTLAHVFDDPYWKYCFGGAFTQIGGKSRNRIAKLSGSTIENWNPNSNGWVGSLVASGSTLYAGGAFTQIGGKSRNSIAALNLSSGTATSWNPNANNNVNTLAVSNSTVYAGGMFTKIGGQTRNNVAALDASTGQATDWNPNANGWVRALAVSDSYVYMGGDFTKMGGKSRPYFAQFALPQAATPTWYLAEGSTAWGFETAVVIENPNDTDVDTRITYMTDAGPVDGGVINLPRESQTCMYPDEILGEKDFSTKVECLDKSKTIAVDREIYWELSDTASEGHSSIGVTAPAKDWYLPEGSSAWGFECWLLIQNPNAQDVTCTVTYMIEGEGPQQFDKVIPANSRKTFNMANDIGAKDASIQVHCASPVIPERAMYKNNRRMGHDSIGTIEANKQYYLAEGTSAWGFTTYVLVQNPNDDAANVEVTYMTPEGPVPHPENPIAMPANSRKTIRVNDFLPEKDFSTLVEGDAPIIAERAMYWDNGTGEAGHDSIGMAAPHTTFYLPDGWASNTARGGGAQTYTLVQNPGSSDVEVRVTYLPSVEDTAPLSSFTDTVPANSRKTYSMADTSLYPEGASVMVECLTAGGKIMVERAIYWHDKEGGTDTIGGYSD